MNARYFACPTHHSYIDAGYRWAYWTLEEPNIVQLGKAVDVEAVFKAHHYWNPTVSETSQWLYERIFLLVRKYLEYYRGKELIYVDEDYIFQQWELGHDWQEIETANDQRFLR